MKNLAILLIILSINTSGFSKTSVVKVKEVGKYQSEEISYKIVENPPVFPGCERKANRSEIYDCFEKKFDKFIKRRFNKSIEKEIGLSPGEKQMIAAFKINTNGDVINILSRASHPKLEKELERVIALLPKMTPGRTKNGKLATVTYSMDISIVVDKNNETSITPNKTTSIENVEIGTQIWTTKNLDVAKFRNGDAIRHAKTEAEWKNAGILGIPAWCYYKNNSLYGDKYGKLYNWHAMNDPRGLAPEGWKVPSEKDWQKLKDYLGEGASKKLKSEKRYGTNETGFDALLGGFRDNQGNFSSEDIKGFWWTSSDEFDLYGIYIWMHYDLVGVKKSSAKYGYGHSVRLIKE